MAHSYAAEQFGIVFREFRKRAGMTQAEVAEKLGYSDPTYVGRIERGEENPTLHAVTVFIAVVGATLVISAESNKA